MLDMALKVQGARAARLALSAPSSEDIKWACVLLLALMGQISIAMLHLDKPRPHIAAMTILTTSIVLIIVLIAASEGPFQPPIYVRSDPISRVLTLLPEEGVPLPPPAEARERRASTDEAESDLAIRVSCDSQTVESLRRRGDAEHGGGAQHKNAEGEFGRDISGQPPSSARRAPPEARRNRGMATKRL